MGTIMPPRFGRLGTLDLVYPCFCSRADVARLALGRDPDGAPLYRRRAAGAFRLDQRAERLERGERAAWRLDMQTALRRLSAPLGWTEFGEGDAPEKRRAEPELWGDVVLEGTGSRRRAIIWRLRWTMRYRA